MVSQSCKLSSRDLLLQAILSFNTVDIKSWCTSAFIMKILACDCENLKLGIRPTLEMLASTCPKSQWGGWREKSAFVQQNLPYGLLSKRTLHCYIGWELGLGAEWAAEIWSAKGQSAGSCHHLTKLAKLKREPLSLQGFYRLWAVSCTEALQQVSSFDGFVLFVVSCFFVLPCPILDFSINLYVVSSGAQRLESFISEDKISCMYFHSGCLSLCH